MNDYFLSCDWGTSNFRLRLVNISDLNIIAEDANDKGISDTFKAWQALGITDNGKRMSFYRTVIKESIGKLEATTTRSLEGVPVIISGMVSSTIGIVEIPYQPLPFSIDGSGLLTKSLPSSQEFPHEMVIISGVNSEDDVMRGEETQLVGSITDEMRTIGGTQLFIHPGTHSKHIIIENGVVISFKTFMTGEFFKLLTTHGILRDNIQQPRNDESSIAYFNAGVRDSINSNLLHAIFKVRTNDLFKKMSKTENYSYLSGLLIGSELSELKYPDCRIWLGSGATLISHYEAALSTLGLSTKVSVLPSKWIDESVIRGQYKIYRTL